jgi:hypothetical protein
MASHTTPAQFWGKRRVSAALGFSNVSEAALIFSVLLRERSRA